MNRYAPPIMTGLRVLGVFIGIWLAFETLTLGNPDAALRMATVWTVCSIGLITALGNYFFRKDVAESLGWRSGANYQTEHGFFHFAFFLTALTSYFLKWGPETNTAILMPYMLFFFLCALMHLWNAVRFKRYTWQTLTHAFLTFLLIAYLIFFISKALLP
ncbi:MAG: hypothetical protein MRY21_01590 [Simkaniaceae bacterium]|nr:hypothetical protein [Simkaniaceae bacterium]